MREIRADYDNGAKVIVNLCSLFSNRIDVSPPTGTDLDRTGFQTLETQRLSASFP